MFILGSTAHMGERKAVPGVGRQWRTHLRRLRGIGHVFALLPRQVPELGLSPHGQKPPRGPTVLPIVQML
jgi:hypothetical protein